MRDFDRGNNRGGGGRSFDRNDRRPVQMHPATCSNCGNACEVPFKPTGLKPVLCSNCFKSSGGPDRRDNRSFGGAQDRQGGDRRDDRSFGGSQDKRGGFDRPSAPSAPSYQPQFKEQFESLNYKLDKILGLLQTGVLEKTSPKSEEAPVVKKKRAPKKEVAEPETLIETPVEETLVVETPSDTPTE